MIVKHSVRTVGIEFFMLALLFLLQVTTTQGNAPEILLSPTSISVPVNTVAEFDCKINCVERCEAIWYIGGISTAHRRSEFIEQGYDVPQPQRSSGTFWITLSVNASTNVNNTHLQCIVQNILYGAQSARSDPAVLKVHSGSSVLPNPSVILQSMSVLLKWCPPYLWAGHRIKCYTILTTNMTDGSVTIDRINATFSDYIVTLEKSRQDENCAKLSFTLSAINIDNENLKTYEVTKGYEQAPEDFDVEAISTTVLFFANMTPIVRIKAQLPSMICNHQDVNYTIIFDSMNETSIIELGPFHQQGPGIVNHEVVSDRMIKDEEYSVRIILSSYLHTVTSKNHSFNTTFLPEVQSTPQVCIVDGVHSNHAIRKYHLVLAVCACVMFIIFSLATLVIPLWVYRHWKLHKQRKMDGTSAERICNTMVPNPIYSGPLYESVQPRFETLTSTAASTCGEQQTECNSRASTPTSSEKSVRYVDPPSHLPKNRSRSFVSSGPSNSSMPAVDSTNTPRSTSVSVPAIKKTGKQRNKFNLTLTLSGTDSSSTTGSHHAQNSTIEPISAVNPVVLRDVDENYTVMSPASALVGTAK